MGFKMSWVPTPQDPHTTSCPVYAAGGWRRYGERPTIPRRPWSPSSHFPGAVTSQPEAPPSPGSDRDTIQWAESASSCSSPVFGLGRLLGNPVWASVSPSIHPVETSHNGSSCADTPARERVPQTRPRPHPLQPAQEPVG